MPYLWYGVFKTELRIFRKVRKNFVFDHMIKTDGIAVSINIIPIEKYKSKREALKKNKKLIKNLHMN